MVLPTNLGEPLAPTEFHPMTTRKRLDGALPSWHPHPKGSESIPPSKEPASMPPKQSASATESSWPLLKPRASIPPSTETESLAPVVRDAVAADEIAEKFFETPPPMPTPEPLP